jgi:hypothetical protein
MTDFRALCARMADELDHYRQLLMDDRRETHALAVEARAALAEPVATADGEVAELVEWLRRLERRPLGLSADGYANLTRAADLLERLSDGPAVQSREPASVVAEPSDQEIAEWADACDEVPLEALDTEIYGWRRCFTPEEFSGTIRSALDRWGTATPQPVPVTDRLPEAGDCDAEGRCWWLHIGEDGLGDWFQRAPYPSATSYAFFRMTHWLPAHALPLPSGEVES